MEECCHALAGMDFGFAVSTNKNAPAQVCRGVNFNISSVGFLLVFYRAGT